MPYRHRFKSGFLSLLAAVILVVAGLIGTSTLTAVAAPTPAQSAALSHWNKGSVVTSGPTDASVSPANPASILSAHQANLKPIGHNAATARAGGVVPATTPGYALTDTFASGSLASITSASITYGPDEVQGIQEQDGQFVGNHTLQDFIVYGTCAVNTDCISGSAPTVEITLSTGQSYCAPGLLQCFAVFPWRNNAFTNDRSASNPYVEVAGGLPDNGTSGPPPGNSDSYGYAIVSGQFQILVDGVEVGYIPTSWWGQTDYGPITNEALQSESYEGNIDWGVSPEPSEDFTFSSYTDNVGTTTFPAPTAATGYTVSNVNTGSIIYQISGGENPETTGGNWPIELNVDDSPNLCMYDELTPNGSPVISGNCGSPGPGEDWTLNSSGYFVNQKSGKCLTDPSDNTTPGTAMVMETCPVHFLLGATWTTVKEPNGYTWYKDYSGTVCLENKNGVLTAGNPIVVGGCSYPAASELFDASYYP